MFLGAAMGERNALGRIVGGDRKRDRAEEFLHDLRFVAGIDLQQQRGPNARLGELRMFERTAVHHDLAEQTGRVDALRNALVLDRAQYFYCLCRVAGELRDALANRRGDLVEA